jgi:RecA/RadA recombinase
MSERNDDFAERMKKQLGESLYMGTVEKKCWPTSIYDVDRALGGGLPAGAASLLAGPESAGKSTISAKIAGMVSRTNYDSGKLMKPRDKGGCRVLYVDQDNTLDREWCACHDYYPEENGNIVLATDTGNQAIDVINAAIQSKEFSLIILDHLELLIPHRDLEKSSEDASMGTAAKMNNDAYRRWTVSLINAKHNSEKWWQRPTLLVLNQLRDGIGSVPMPPVLPGGKGQKNGSSVIIQMGTPKYADDGKLASIVNFKGVVKKNKVATPRAPISFEMAVQDLPERGLKKGQVDNITSVLQDVRKYNMWEQKGKKWHLFEYEVDKQADFKDLMMSDPNIEQAITQKVIERLRK